jgi:Tol biopolymer transport system component
MRVFRAVCLAAAVFLALAPPAAAASKERKITAGTDPAVSPDGERLAFVRTVKGNADVYTCRLDGSDMTRLTRHDGRDASPDWSPDGTRIVFSSTRSGGSDLYAIPADGSGEPERLTDLPGREYDPAWSPDGQRIAFTLLDEGRAGLAMVSASGGAVTRLRTGPGVSVREELSEPTWAPDGRRLVAVTDRNGDYDLVLLRLTRDETVDAEIVPVGESDELEPSWNPTRELVAFTSNLRLQDTDVFADENGPGSTAAEPATARFGVRDARTVFLTGPGPHPHVRPVLRPTHETAQPDWTPDGRSLVYVRGESVRPGAPSSQGPEIWLRENLLRAETKRKKK